MPRKTLEQWIDDVRQNPMGFFVQPSDPRISDARIARHTLLDRLEEASRYPHLFWEHITASELERLLQAVLKMEMVPTLERLAMDLFVSELSVAVLTQQVAIEQLTETDSERQRIESVAKLLRERCLQKLRNQASD